MNFSKDSNEKKKKELDSKSSKATKSVSTSFIKILVFAFLLLIIVGVCAGLGFVKSIIDSAPDINVEDIVPKGYTSFIYDQDGNEIVQLHGSNANRIFVELDEIPTYLQDSFIAIEDERFWQHNGIDVKGIFRAIFTNIKEKSFSEGASTITQQLIKNNILSTETTLQRKIQEQYLAVQLEKKSDKKTILENYLNTVALGRGTNGVQAAANKYFNKDVSELTIAESAVIASITKNPSFYDPVTYPENNKRRQTRILKKLIEQEKITQAQYDEALKEDVYNNIQIVNKTYAGNSSYSYYVDEVISRVKNDLMVKKGYTETQAFNLIYRGGLSIYINQDTDIQKIVDETYTNEDFFPKKNVDYSVILDYSVTVKDKDGNKKDINKNKTFETDQEANDYIEQLKKELTGEGYEIVAEKPTYIPQPQSAMVIIDQHTGYVKALSGGRGEKVGNLTFNRATTSTRSPGSTFKILAAYLPALDTAGYTLATVIDDVPTQFPNEPKGWPKNYDYKFRGLTTVREGILYSMNILAVKTLNDIGVQTGFDYLLKLGFTTLVDKETVNGKSFTDKGLSLTLGGLTKGVTVLELTGAYAAIANNGVYIEPTFYSRVLDHDGKLLMQKEPVTRTVMKETTAFLLTDAMVDVVRLKAGTGHKVQFSGMPIAGKTGTSTGDKDLVFAGFTPYYTAVVWKGYDIQKEQRYLNYHKKIWKEVMQRIHEGLPRKEFDKPSGIVTKKICTESGKLAVPGLCDKDQRGSTVRTEYFAKGTEPTEPCDVHIKATICKDSGLFATEYCPESSKVEKVYIQRLVPFVPEEWDPRRPPTIQDRQYELPPSMIGEYCNIHGPEPEVPDILPPVYIDPNGNNNDNTNDNSNTNDVNSDLFTPFLPKEHNNDPNSDNNTNANP
ncbi:transglycosylase domain-containing protein [Vallitalea maricola]|uniref:Penicillin-binding protein 1A n=1 Tax=Vallitalea maricola TaxID=3074433 RepID=A0ACB5UMT7_9FIRM|nr:penicillin-binding protein 1A [Vallitalea sp. AN17-2]